MFVSQSLLDTPSTFLLTPNCSPDVISSSISSLSALSIPEVPTPSYVCEWEIYSCCRDQPASPGPLSHQLHQVLCHQSFHTPSMLLQHLLHDHISMNAMDRCHQCHWHGCTKVFRTSSKYLRRHHLKSHVEGIQLDRTLEVVSVSTSSIASLSPSPVEDLPVSSRSLESPVFMDSETQTSPAPVTVELVPDGMAALPDLVHSLQQTLQHLSTAPSTQAYRAILGRLDTLQETFHRYHLEWTAHRICNQQQMKDIEKGMSALKASASNFQS